MPEKVCKTRKRLTLSQVIGTFGKATKPTKHFALFVGRLKLGLEMWWDGWLDWMRSASPFV